MQRDGSVARHSDDTGMRKAQSLPFTTHNPRYKCGGEESVIFCRHSHEASYSPKQLEKVAREYWGGRVSRCTHALEHIFVAKKVESGKEATTGRDKVINSCLNP